jgi:glycosidase
MNILGTHDTARILTVLGGKQCFSKSEMANPCNMLSEAEKGVALNKLKAASLLQFTIFGVPCIYYGDENAQEGYIDPFCRQCYDWEKQNEELIEHYQKLGKIRKNYSEIFKDGDFEEIYSDRGLYVFKRCKQGKAIYVFVNRSSEKFSLQIKGTFKELLFGNTFENVLTIDGFENGIFVKV